MTGYSQVYEAVPRLAPTLGAMAFGLVFVFIGVGLIVAGRHGSDQGLSKRPHVALAGGLFCFFSALWTIAVGTEGISRWYGIRQALDHGKYQVASGLVEGLDMSLERYPSVWFSVAGQDFRFHGDRDTAGFRGRPETWLLKEGQAVRLSYICRGFGPSCIDPIIVRAEVQDAP